jgi:hypothetical protein
MHSSRRVLVVVLAIAAVLVATAGMAGAADNRATPKGLTASTTPTRDRTAPYDFTTSGQLVLPDQLQMCPAGTSDPNYCTSFTKKQACQGTVRVTYEQGGKTIKTIDDSLDKKCQYSASVSLTAKQVKTGSLTIKVQFLGNDYLKPVSAPSNTVQIG